MARIPWGMIYVGSVAYSIYTSSLPTFIFASIIIIAFRILHTSFLYPKYLTPLKHIPTPPKRSWITGNAGTYLLQTPFEDLIKWTKSVPNDGLLRYYVFGNMERLLVYSPKALSELLVQNTYEFEKPEMMRRSLGRIAGKSGILLVEGSEHKRHRKNLMPAFSYRHIKDLYPIFWAKSIEMVKGIEEELKARGSGQDNVVEIRPWASRATLDIIGLAGMNRDFGSLADPKNELAAQYHRILQEAPVWLMVLFAICFVMGNVRPIQALPVQRNQDITEGSNYVRRVAQQLINEQKEAIKRNPEASETGKDILSVAVNSGNFTDEELVDQMMTFLAAGHETTSTALQWAVYALCKHPEVQTRLREEIRANLPPISVDNPEPITAATLDTLPYLHAVCNEVHRFHPSVPMTMRNTPHDTTLAGTPIPKGVQLIISAEVINHHTDFWGPTADKFDPERWLGPGQANTGGATSNYALMTFLHGPRSCIGQGFAKAELASLVAATVGRFHMELKDPNAGLKLKRSATISPLDGVLAKLTPLDGW
ncbi:cytochrome P450 [Aspergillus heterothallicus]